MSEDEEDRSSLSSMLNTDTALSLSSEDELENTSLKLNTSIMADLMSSLDEDEDRSSLYSSLDAGLELGLEGDDEDRGLNLNLWTGLMLDAMYEGQDNEDSILEL